MKYFQILLICTVIFILLLSSLFSSKCQKETFSNEERKERKTAYEDLNREQNITDKCIPWNEVIKNCKNESGTFDNSSGVCVLDNTEYDEIAGNETILFQNSCITTTNRNKPFCVVKNGTQQIAKDCRLRSNISNKIVDKTIDGKQCISWK